MKFFKKAATSKAVVGKNKGYWKANGMGARLFDSSGMLIQNVVLEDHVSLYGFYHRHKWYYYDTLEQAKAGAEVAYNYTTSKETEQ